MPVSKKTTHTREALALLVSQFKEKPKIKAILDASTDQTQEDENAFFELLDLRGLETATGEQLDGIGAIVGEDRLGRSDEDYRFGIRAQIRKNVSSGTPDEILEIVALLTLNLHDLTEYFPGGFVLRFADELTEDPEALAANLPAPAGVRGSVEYTLTDDDQTFQFASGDTAETDQDTGFASELIVAVGVADGADAYIVTSPDGSTWTERSNPSNFPLQGVAFDGSQFIGVGPSSYAVKSSDGITWAQIAIGGGGTHLAVEYANGLWVVGGLFGAIFTSPDGSTWTAQTSGTAQSIFGLHYHAAGAQWVAVCSGGVVLTSPDGIAWTTQSTPKATALLAVTSDPAGLLVAVGAPDGGDSYLVTSPDGIVWTERANPKAVGLGGVAHDGAALFVAVGIQDGADAYIVTSPDGSTWTERANPKNVALAEVRFSQPERQWVAVGSADGADAYLLTSPDGIVWTEQTNPKNFSLVHLVIAEYGGDFADAVEI